MPKTITIDLLNPDLGELKSLQAGQTLEVKANDGETLELEVKDGAEEKEEPEEEPEEAAADSGPANPAMKSLMEDEEE